jgi:cytochrome c oxidase assembly factor CtaG
MEDTPRDRLRGLVSGVGLLQYLLAPLCVVFGIIHSRRESAVWPRRVAVVCWVVGSVAFILAVYRGYLSSID